MSPTKLDAVPGSLFQHPAWLDWKESQGWRQLDTGLGFCLLVREIVGIGTVAYCAAPHILPGAYLRSIDERGRILEDLSLRVEPFLPPGCAFLRWDLMTAAWTDEEGNRLEDRLQELRMNASTRWRRFRKAPNEKTCTDTMVVDLAGGASAIAPRLDERTRYSIRLAARRGTEVTRTGEEGLGDFQALFDQTARRQGFPAQSKETFERLFEYGRRYGLALDLYLARSNGEPAAAAIFARHRGSAWYLFAASSAAHREAAGPSAILYRALVDCAEAGCREMDLLGVAPPGCAGHPLAGLSRFKSGFGGRRISRAGAWDYLVDAEAYSDYARGGGLLALAR